MEEDDKNNQFFNSNELVHFKKVNLFGLSNVGKKSLLLKFSHNSLNADKDMILKIQEDKNDEQQNNENNTNMKLVESVNKFSIKYQTNKILNINIYTTNLDNLELIKENLDTLLVFSECVIFMIDITSLKSFELIKEIIPLVYNELKKNIQYGEVPIFFINNKEDLDKDRIISGFEIKEFTDSFPNIKSFDLSLNKKDEENIEREQINEFISKFCETISEKTKTYSYKYEFLNLVKIHEPINLHKDAHILQQTEFKIILMLLGSSAVGKSSFALKLFQNKFTFVMTSTQGADLLFTCADLYGHLVKIELWDTAGQERLRSLPQKYYSKTDAMLLLFDVCDKNSFEDISGWIKSIREARGINEGENFNKKPEEEVVFLIGNKIDNVKKRQVKKEEAKQLANSFNLKYFEISVKNGINIYEIFSSLIFEANSKFKRESTNFALKKQLNNVKGHKKKKFC